MPSDLPRTLQEEEPEEGPRMPLGAHLDELRYRLILGLVGFTVLFLVALWFGEDLIVFLLEPLNRVQRRVGLPPSTVALKVTTALSVYIKVSVVAGLIAGAPWFVYQFWCFVKEGLRASEQRAVLLLCPFSALMSVAGVAFAYFVLLPLSLSFLIAFTVGFPPPETGGERDVGLLGNAAVKWSGLSSLEKSSVPATRPAPEPVRLPVRARAPSAPAEGETWIRRDTQALRVHVGGETRTYTPSASSVMTPVIDVESYIGFVVLMMLAVALAFQLPPAMLVIGWTGLVHPAWVARSRKYTVFGCFAAAAVLTPQDPISMLALGLPLWALFELGLMLMRWASPEEEANAPES